MSVVEFDGFKHASALLPRRRLSLPSFAPAHCSVFPRRAHCWEDAPSRKRKGTSEAQRFRSLSNLGGIYNTTDAFCAGFLCAILPRPAFGAEVPSSFEPLCVEESGGRLVRVSARLPARRMASREKKRKSHISAWGLFPVDGVVKNKRSPTMSWKD